MIEYNRTNWRAGREGGTAWTHSRLNNIENGIEQATNQINQNSKDIETINSNLSTLTSRIKFEKGTSTGYDYMTPQIPAFILVSATYQGGVSSAICYYSPQNYSLTSIVTSNSSIQVSAQYKGIKTTFHFKYNEEERASDYIIIPFIA